MTLHTHSFFPHHIAVRQCILDQIHKLHDRRDWLNWRFCFEGGRHFRERFLKQFQGKEDQIDFLRRRDFTPIPAYAKREIKAVKNSISSRLRDVIRTEGSDQWRDAVDGNGRGVDLRGSGMNSFLSMRIISEMLVMRQVGILVDAPTGDFESLADIPPTFQPYLNRFTVEEMPILVPAPEWSESDWSSVLLESNTQRFNLMTGKNECVKTFRYYWLDEFRDGRVSFIKLNEAGAPISEIIELSITQIPLVVMEIEQSLMEDVCEHQIALLNMISADTSYAIDANYSFLTRQRGHDGLGAHLESDKKETIKTGSLRGLWYGKGQDRPGFISPPTKPLNASLELRRELKTEVHELVRGSLADMGDGDVDAGLSVIGNTLATGERRLWDHWVIFEESRESRRQIPRIKYPSSWTIKTDAERLQESTEFMRLANVMVGQKNKKRMSKRAADIMHRGCVSTDELKAIMTEIDNAPFAISDPEVTFRAKKEGLVSVDTGSLALGYDPGEAEKAKQDAAERAAMVVAAQADADAGAARGNPDGSVDSNANELAREGETDGAGNLRETRDPGRPETNE